MADQKTTDAGLQAIVKTYFEKKTLESFEPMTAWYKECPVKSVIPKGSGRTIEWTRYKKIAPVRSDNTDEYTAQQIYQSAETVTATLRSRDAYVQLSRDVDLFGISDPLTQAANKVKMAALKTVDIMIRNDIGMMVADVQNASSLYYDRMAIDGGSLNSTGITARIWSHDRSANGDRFPVYHNKTRLAQSALVTSIAKSAMTVKTIQHGVNVLEAKDIPPLSDGYYRMITRPEVGFQINTTPGLKGWLSYTTPEQMQKAPSEVGIIGKTKVVTTTLGYAFPLSGDTMSTASGKLFSSLLFGEEAYACAQVQGKDGKTGFSFYLKQSGDQSTNDPTNMKKQAAFSVTNVGKILNKSAGLWILSTEKY